MAAVVWATVAAAGGPSLAADERPDHFRFADVSFDRSFAAGAFDECVAIDETQFELTIRPENVPINNSAWYAFRVAAASPRTITVTLRYENGRHRYVPKISRDGCEWTVLPADAVDVQGSSASLRLEVGPEPLWVAAQELITSRELTAWADALTQHPFVRKSTIGESIEGRPIWKLQIGSPDAADAVYVIGRQHPPEVTGSLGLMHFVEALSEDSPLANRFRRRFQTIVVPLVNPDGVERGYWRHNVDGVDLNRDWERFAQPETRAVRDELLEFAGEDAPRLHLFLDFHSTHHDVFYTQSDDSELFTAGLTDRWLDALQQRFPDYQVRREPFGEGRATSTRWVGRALQTTAIIYEWGDRTPRDTIERVARGAAEELMQLLLDAEPASTRNPSARSGELVAP